MIEDLTGFFLDVAVLAAGLLVALAVGPIILVVVVPVLATRFASNYIRSLVRALIPDRFGLAGPEVIRPEPGSEPALTQYFFGQAVADVRGILRRTWRNNQTVARGKWAWDVVRWLVQGKSADPKRPAYSPRYRTFLAPIAGVFALGGLSGALLASVAIAIVGVAHVLIIMVAALISRAGIATVRGLQYVAGLVKRARVSCPHPPCYASIALPAYACSNDTCNLRHLRLEPGRLGVLSHTCLCGERLPTVMQLGRRRLTAYCPQPSCGKQLPDEIGQARATHFPMVGGPSAGKTMLLTSMMLALDRRSRRGDIAFELATESDRRDFDSARVRLEQGLDVDKTVFQLPRAVLFSVGPKGHEQRLVYMYDPAGEYYLAAGQVEQQGYLRHSRGVLLVVDPFAVPAFASGLGPHDQAVATAARPSPEEPTTTYARFSQAVRLMADARLERIPVAVVVPKHDALAQLRRGPVPPAGAGSDDVRAWVQSIGLDNLVRGLDLEFGDVRYFLVSARAAAASPTTDDSVLMPLAWLLERNGAPLASPVAASDR